MGYEFEKVQTIIARLKHKNQKLKTEKNLFKNVRIMKNIKILQNGSNPGLLIWYLSQTKPLSTKNFFLKNLNMIASFFQKLPKLDNRFVAI